MFKTAKKIFTIILITAIILILLLFFIRLFSHREIDDLHPNIPCEQAYIQKSDILWVIPKFHGKKITDNKSWCKYILSLNKTLGLHGYEHYYKEFERKNFTQEEITEDKELFKECFGYYPTMFKPPQLALNDYNKKLVEKNNLTIKGHFNQITHKVYHCDNDTTTNEFGGIFPNTYIDIY